MAITWGPTKSAGFPKIRVGIEISTSGVSNSSSKVTATVDYWIGVVAHSADQPTLHMTGAISDSVQFSNNRGQNGNPNWFNAKIATRTYTYTYGANEYGSSPGRRTFGAYITGTYNGLSPSVSTPWQIPARPYAAPADPSALSMHWKGDGSGSSDTIVCTWTRHSTAAAPYNSVHVDLAYFTGSDWTPYGSNGGVNLTGSASSYSVGVQTPNRAYRFRVNASNPAGKSGTVYISPLFLYSPPAAPDSVKARVSSDGGSIILTWNPNCYTQGTTTHEVYRSVNGGSYASVKTGLSASSTGWTDASPGAGTNTYQVRAKHAKETLDKVDLYSPWATSNTVSTIVAPLAPTNLGPNGVAVDLTQDVPLSWQHNDGGDGADPSAFKIQYSTDSGSTWIDLTSQTSTDTEWVLPGGTLPNGATYQWRVSDEGVTSAGFGPWSNAATFTGSAAPTVTITAPTGTVTTGHITESWTYAQADGSVQARAVASLWDASGNLLEWHGITGDGATQAFSTYCHDGLTYTVTVLVTSAAGLTASDSSTFTVDVPQPAPLAITWSGLPTAYDVETGSMVFHIEPQEPGTGQAETVAASVERSTDGGNTWVRLFDEIALPMDIVDPLPLTFGQTTYRMTSISAEPGYYANPDLVIDAPSGDVIGDPLPMTLPAVLSSTPTPDDVWRPLNRWVFVNYGDDFSQQVRVGSANLQFQASVSSSATLTPLAGHALPRQTFGVQESQTVAVSGDLLDSRYAIGGADSSPVEWETAGRKAKVICYRDPEGRRLFGLLSGVQTASSSKGIGTVSFSVSEDDTIESWG